MCPRSLTRLLLRRLAATLILLSVAGLALAVGMLASSPGARADFALHGIAFFKGCHTPTNVGQPYVCTYQAINAVDTQHDTVTITSVVDVVHPFPCDVTSANLLPTATLSLGGGATCNPGQTLCTLPFGASVTFSATFYTVQPGDPNPLTDTATLTFQDTCTDGTPSPNCPLGQTLHAQAGSQTDVPDAQPTPSCMTSTHNGISTCDMQPGDVLLNHNNNPLYDALNLRFIGSYWSHAGIYVGDNEIVESYASWPSDTPGVVWKRICESVHGGFWDAEDWAVLRPKSAISTPAQRAAAAQWAVTQRGKPFNWDVLRSGCTIQPEWPECNGSYYCSQLVYQAYRYEGIDIQVDKVPFVVAPAELYNTSKMDVIDSPALRRRAVVSDFSPADLYATDPEGRHVGVDPHTGATVNEIPGVFFSGAGTEPEFMSIPDMNGSWQVQLIGTGTGSYTFTADTVDPDGAVETSVTGDTSIGHIDSYSLSYPAQAGDPITVQPVSPVGGISDIPDVPGAHLQGSASDKSRIPISEGMAAVLTASVVALGVGGWYAKRRWRIARGN